MTPILEEAQLGTDLDCQGLDIKNISHMYPVPPGLVDAKDPLLYDPRVPPFASVTDDHVTDTAGIQQSKLSLNGTIPVAWLGSSSDKAAPGNLVEQVARKGAIGGYASIDATTGKIFSSHVTPGASPGTVNSVGLQMPEPLYVATTPNPIITGGGGFDVQWHDVPDQSWLGAEGFTQDQIPMGLIPAFSATKFTTGTFALDQLPVATGLGVGHAPGVVPDPGAVGGVGEYLGRDMQWHQFTTGTPYQPFLPKPSIQLLSSGDSAICIVAIRTEFPGAILFYRVTDPSAMSVFVVKFTKAESTALTLSVREGYLVEAYVAKTGYNNSLINSYTVVPLLGV